MNLDLDPNPEHDTDDLPGDNNEVLTGHDDDDPGAIPPPIEFWKVEGAEDLPDEVKTSPIPRHDQADD